MDKQISEWNGYSVHGDVKELDGIVNSNGFITLVKNDIINVLSAGGDSYVTSGTNCNFGNAFNEAVNCLPCEIDKVNILLIDFRYGTQQPKMAEFSTITDKLAGANADIEITWGMRSDDSLGESYKVVLVASVKN